MTDTTRDSALSTDSVVPITTDATGGPEAPAGCPGEGREGAFARYRRLGGATRTADVLDLGGADRVLRPHGGVSRSCSPAPTRPSRTCPRPAKRPRPTPGSAGTVRATTSTHGPSTVPEPRSWSACSPRCSWQCSARSSASSPVTEPAGWIRCSAASARSSSASRCCWAGFCFSTSSPTTR